jgi:hypothetical protein
LPCRVFTERGQADVGQWQNGLRCWRLGLAVQERR